MIVPEKLPVSSALSAFPEVSQLASPTAVAAAACAVIEQGQSR